jgi:transcriptional activator SPT7
MNVLSGVLSEYLMNVGRTARFLCDQFSDRMSAEEMILHTLFESGTTRISDLERYIQEDVVRYGSRMGELEKKLVAAYREVRDSDWSSESRVEVDGRTLGGY